MTEADEYVDEKDSIHFKPLDQSKTLGYVTVVSGIMIHLFCGNLYLWGNIANYVISYFHYLGDEQATLK